MTTEYTRTEQEIIRQAWAKLMHYAEGNSAIGAPEQLEDAAREERQNVSLPTVARALLLTTLAETCDPDHRTGNDPAELWSYRQPHRDIIAFAWMHRDALIADGVTYAARQAANAHHKASRRALDALRT